MKPVAVVVRYRYGDRGGAEEGSGATFFGSFHDRSRSAVLGRLREVHRLAAWIEIVDLEWRDAQETDARETKPSRGD